MKKIIYLRSTSILNDSRATKEIKTYIANGNEVTVLGWNRQNLEDIVIKEDNNYAKIDMFDLKSNYGDGFKNIFKLLKFEFWLYRKLKNYINQYDIIHACDFETAYVASKIAKKYNKKFIYDIYDYYVDCHNLKFMSKLVEKVDIKVINSADCVLLCTEQRKEQIKKSNPKKVEIIHNTPIIKETYTNKEFTKEKIKVCYVGILQDDRLLCEIGENISKNPNVEFHIGGFGKYEKYFEDLSKKYSNVKFYGQMKYDDVLNLESKCDILFATYNPKIPNHKYSAPNKVYEAMALGKPIIVCNKTGVDHLVKKENIGFVIEYNADNFFKCLANLDNLKYDIISKKTKKLYKEKYSWDVMENKILKLINKI